MKKQITWFMMIVLLCVTLSGCNGSTNTKDDRLQVVCTIFPIYDWVREICGSQTANTELTLLLDNGADLHNYQPSVEDIVKISGCDIFIYVGGESDAWVEGVLKEATNPDMRVISLLDVLGDQVKQEELVEGMEEEAHEHEAEHETDSHEADAEHETDSHEADEHDEHHEEIEYDEHVWLSLRNAEIFCNEIERQLSDIDADNATVYKDNVVNYIGKLQELDTAYATAIDAASKQTLVFADRFPFRYLADDYNLQYYAAFVGCSAETEASFETILFLANKADELAVPAILVIESSDQKLAKTVIENSADASRPILVMDSLQSITEEELNGEVTYVSVMQKNLDTLKEALR